MAGKGKRKIEAIGYMRTSSATNVGRDKDSEVRQRAAIESYAKAAGYTIVDWFYEGAAELTLPPTAAYGGGVCADGPPRLPPVPPMRASLGKRFVGHHPGSHHNESSPIVVADGESNAKIDPRLNLSGPA